MSSFGSYVRERRERLKASDATFSVRQLAVRIGVEPSFLSKVERGETPPPSEEKVKALAIELGEDPDVLLALAGKVSSDLQEAIRKRPELFAAVIRELKDVPDQAVLRIVREVRDGKW
ncbi:MAG: helix-turn-helix domain-containing protein [Gemmatimonadota bacterium]|nr:helix-turn-helix domain-containing protein [Gemmatimonadota bacterium]MDH3369146.1 helix-turn-helix domain-containing protein [Gemmatimonadota bacterium]MDH3479698.1 helix-turn-helix domain-containing protein [Gemmatimonadota bacterium]MDH3570278.1 helix-turn-helix domain-containing protein [Gemmatimonadota bacterium]MDH5549826.1 helix-turn-helix domain-containing protein [Gemmatimonadota bacterium]